MTLQPEAVVKNLVSCVKVYLTVSLEGLCFIQGRDIYCSVSLFLGILGSVTSFALEIVSVYSCLPIYLFILYFARRLPYIKENLLYLSF